MQRSQISASARRGKKKKRDGISILSRREDLRGFRSRRGERETPRLCLTKTGLFAWPFFYYMIDFFGEGRYTVVGEIGFRRGCFLDWGHARACVCIYDVLWVVCLCVLSD